MRNVTKTQNKGKVSINLKKLLICSLASLTFCATPAVFANDLDASSIGEKQISEISYEIVETENENEYLLQPIVSNGVSINSINTGEQTKTLAAGADTYYIFDNDALFGFHKKCKVTIIKNPGLNLKVTLINRDTGVTVDSTNFYGGTGEYTFNLDSDLADYKIYIGNKSSESGQIKFSIKSS
ncbi:hypothetical protein M670_04185 [Schinkia azotoformans MEV2011]|uniref:Uncharacterized protein n=1 Tax=Schinkia azotoformans MEV2011 TaxID=1348973 RepID=A0A072NIE2_SCHAZ|nr:hypothetical protein [Schinkia azotoformans]KEF36623.1 hypothetical protein M670_04185 [Schinkia azotoformans MEV2011]MEC1695588.1 hypothetical protein [Schinkia azotoformans]MEC1718652.1 hypothetical protein [Schinkia azotoformans]MEC1723983.1 hypothetical protein [Schinkia azotoformans]MEC1740765.1 hypothetical protein [Schinkia azotoformans]